MAFYNFSINKNLIALTTTVSNGNMAFQVGDNKEEVVNNRKLLCKELAIEPDHLIFTHQFHSDIIREVTLEDVGKGENSFESGIDGDGLYTKERDLAIGIFHADCVPIFFFDNEKGIVGIIHSGYKGTKNHVAYKMLREVINKEHINPINIKIILGPHRRMKSYNLDYFEEQHLLESCCVVNNHCFDVTSTVIRDIQLAGVQLENIYDCQINTINNVKCFSAYKKTPVGRMASIIMLK